jgi:type IV pilus assembly protein PilN
VTLFTSWGVSDRSTGSSDRNELLKTEIAELDRQITEILGLEAQKQRLQARIEVIERLQRSRPEVVHVFDQLVRTLPDGVYLTSVKQTDKRSSSRASRSPRPACPRSCATSRASRGCRNRSCRSSRAEEPVAGQRLHAVRDAEASPTRPRRTEKAAPGGARAPARREQPDEPPRRTEAARSKDPAAGRSRSARGAIADLAGADRLPRLLFPIRNQMPSSRRREQRRAGRC